MGTPLPYDTIDGVRARMADISPIFNSPGVVHSSSAELARMTLEWRPDGSAPLSAAPLVSGVRNFYMTDAVSRASATMAKCTQAFGKRV